jgi:hypothetical protein
MMSRASSILTTGLIAGIAVMDTCPLALKNSHASIPKKDATNALMRATSAKAKGDGTENDTSDYEHQ